jgi:hypothetical protein
VAVAVAVQVIVRRGEQVRLPTSPTRETQQVKRLRHLVAVGKVTAVAVELVLSPVQPVGLVAT